MNDMRRADSAMGDGLGKENDMSKVTGTGVGAPATTRGVIDSVGAGRSGPDPDAGESGRP
jgi:hypothetical protein